MDELKEIQIEVVRAFSEKAADTALGFIADIIRPPAKELGAYLAYRVKSYCFKDNITNSIKIMSKAKELHSQFGCRPQKVPLKFLVNMMDRSSWEEDEVMQSKWAALLANAAKEGEQTTNYLIYEELLNQLTPAHAKCLDEIYGQKEYPVRRFSRNLPRALPSYWHTGRLRYILDLSEDEVNIILDNLVRLNLVHLKLSNEEGSFGMQDGGSIDTKEIEIGKDYEEASLTFLGQSLVKKCRISFTEHHKEQIRVICMEQIDEIVEDFTPEYFNPKGKPLTTLVQNSKEVYEYLIDFDIQESTRRALAKESDRIKTEGLPLNSSTRDKIIDNILHGLESIHT